MRKGSAAIQLLAAVGWLSGCAVCGCGGGAPNGGPEATSAAAAPERVPAPSSPDGAREFGRALRQGTEEVALSDLLEHPETYADHSVRTSGTVARVCQKMGCWMELRVPDGDATLRAPMAGHAFFLPQDVIGRAAVVEGTVRVKPLTEDQKAHYRSEGMRAVEVAASLDAEAVRVSAP